MGDVPGASLAVKQGGTFAMVRKLGHVLTGTITAPGPVAVRTTSRERARTRIIEVGPEVSRIEFDRFYVEGRVEMVQVINNAGEASAAFRGFELG